MEGEAAPPPVGLDFTDSPRSSPVEENGAATKLQKVYRSYRTRRKLADSAVVVEELWWQALDFARSATAPPPSSTNPSRRPPPRAGTASALTHPRLDDGEGKDLDLPECPRAKLRKQCIKYLGPQEREHYEYIIYEGKIIHKQSGEPLDTSQGPKGTKWIFVMSTEKRLYAGKKERGVFQHSSFLAGGTTIAAGRFTAENGIIKSIWAYSGHYKPSAENLSNFMSFLEENGVDLKEVEVRSSTKEDYNEDPVPDGSQNLTAEFMGPVPPEVISSPNMTEGEGENVPAEQAKPIYQRTLSGGLQSPRATGVPQKAILERMKSKGESKSYQLGHRLSLKWSTGAGPRIGCVKDYPMELRMQALEMVDLSPRASTPSASRRLPSCLSPTKATSPTSPLGPVQTSLPQPS